jgi:Phosphate-selective porin O and P
MKPVLLVLCLANDGSWASLDREISALESNLSAQSVGPRIDGFLRFRASNSGDADIDPAPGSQSFSGFTVDNARIEFRGEPRDGWSYLVSLEAGHQGELDTFEGPNVDVMDAYVTAPVCSKTALVAGQFCAMFLWSGCTAERNLLFLDRTFLGENWDGRDVGAGITSTIGPVDLWLADQNGFDGKGEHQAFTARAAWRVWGDAGWCCEGSCFGGGERLTVGAAVFEDRSMEHGTAVGADVLYVHKRFGAHVEAVKYGSDMRPMPQIDPATCAIIPGMMDPNGSNTPWDATVSWAIEPDAWEVAVRGQKLDDMNDTSILSFVVDRYVGGRNVKWTLQYDRSKSDDPTLEFDVLGVGLTVGF